MRKYEATALLPDLSIVHKAHVAPALALFEDATTAFARGTLLPTVRGPVAIEDLLPGDYLQTSEGTQPVLWIGSTTYVPGIDDDVSTLARLARITADAFGPSRPMSDVLVGPAARMVLRRDRLRALIGQDRVLVPVLEFADGERIVQITPAGAVQMYHLMVPRHGTLRVGGIEMESYHPGKAIAKPLPDALRGLFLGMFPNIGVMQDFGDLSMTRTTRAAIDALIAS
ncbi:Hint domain-containing protein [Citreicella sp. C3M06]|uniref:Hint domain-containing protein n=1 Tax=Citreicella sp. C3M06 TaxID=2841564 RepID=UPI001C08C67D|nr:Hint domain-containing protein [Citreicella sp. C3M06]MBU2959846.1 Hint domain-containing protein [Citreicella sp. C3M06]